MEIIDSSKNSQELSRRDKINWALRILLSALFIVSAVAKLYPSPNLGVNTFIYKQLIPMGFGETFANHFSRLLIGCELALGILLLQRHYFKRLILPVSFLMLLVFTVHLTYEKLTQKGGNCGCFGELIPMTPLEAIIKNVIAMALIALVYRRVRLSQDKLNFMLPLSVVLACALLLYMIAPFTSSVSSVQQSSEVPVTEEPVMTNDTVPATNETPAAVPPGAPKDTAKASIAAAPAEPKQKASGYKQYFSDIDKDKKILCFFAPGCEHCQQTVKELTELRKADKDFPDIRIIFMDEEAELIPEFFNIAGAKYPYLVMDIGQFWKTLGGTRDTPGVFYLWNGNVLKAYDGINEKAFNKAELRKIVAKPWTGK
jgi:thiol-disulfide isomerase/thioredoxin